MVPRTPSMPCGNMHSPACAHPLVSWSWTRSFMRGRNIDAVNLGLLRTPLLPPGPTRLLPGGKHPCPLPYALVFSCTHLSQNAMILLLGFSKELGVDFARYGRAFSEDTGLVLLCSCYVAAVFSLGGMLTDGRGRAIEGCFCI